MQNNIGEARREYADKVGKFTQEDAAAYFGVSLSTYKKWEQGQGMMNGSQLKAIAEKYDTTVDYLLRRVSVAVVETPIDEPTTLDERELLSLYRRMEPAQRLAFMEVARSMAVASEKDGAGARRDVEVVI